MSLLTKPSALHPGDEIAVISISSPSPKENIDAGSAALERLGFSITYAGNLFDRDFSYLSGPDDRRAAEINRFLSDDRFGGYIFSRGGYGAMRVLDRIDYDAIARNPRPIIGYSDVTALHQAVAVRAGVASFHGPMVNGDFREGLSFDRERWFLDGLAGEAGLTLRFGENDVLAEGRAEGILFGGCLSLTTALTATPYDFWVDGGIWFWEEVSEPTYRIDRMLTHLRLSGRLASIRAVIIGTLKECGGEIPEELERLLSDFFAPLGVPVVRNLPFGHAGDNLLMPIGAFVRLDTRAGVLEFPEPMVDLERRRR